jgi:hypothetical protein
LQQHCRPGCSNPRCAWQLIGGIAAQGDEIRNLLGLDAIPRSNLSGIDTRHLARADRIKNGRAMRGKLKRVAVAARNKHSTAAPFFLCSSGGKKIIRLEAWRFRILETAGGNKFRQHIELLEQSVVKLPTTLVSRKFLMPVGGDFQRIPSDEHGAWLLLAVEPQQHIREA